MQIKVKNLKAEEVGTIDLADEVFGCNSVSTLTIQYSAVYNLDR